MNTPFSATYPLIDMLACSHFAVYFSLISLYVKKNKCERILWKWVSAWNSWRLCEQFCGFTLHQSSTGESLGMEGSLSACGRWTMISACSKDCLNGKIDQKWELCKKTSPPFYNVWDLLSGFNKAKIRSILIEMHASTNLWHNMLNLCSNPSKISPYFHRRSYLC